MAKRKKLQDQNPPRRVEIRGQDHLLAYITPEEAALLKARGGSGEPGPMGIPQYGYGDNDGSEGYGDGDSDSGTGTDGAGSSGGNGGNDGGFSDDFDADLADSTGAQVGTSSGGYDTIGKAAEKDFGTPDPSSQDIEAARGFDFGSEASKAMEQSFASGFNQMDKGLGYNVSGLELDRAFGQLDDRMARAESLPGLLGVMANFNLSNIRSGLQKGYAPAFDRAGNIQGAFGPDPFGFGGLVYSGNPIEGNKATGWSDPTEGGDGYTQTVKPADPITGECEEGYVFDEKLNACRLDTPGFGDTIDSEDRTESGTYARLGLLDVAPTSLFDFYSRYGVQPQDFDAANLAYRRGAGTQFGIYKDPYQKEGYTLLA